MKAAAVPEKGMPPQVRAIDWLITAVFGPCEWLDGLVYRALALRYATRPPGAGQPDAVHFLVGSLDLGGTQRQLATLVRFLVRRGHRCKVWLQHEGGCFTAEVEAAGAAWECVFQAPPSPWSGRWLFRAWRRLRARSHVLTALALAARLRRERPAVLQCLLDTTNVAGAMAGRMAGVPVVVAGLRSLHPGQRATGVAARFQQRCYRLLNPPLVDAVIANSEAGRASFLRWQPEMHAAKVRVVQNGMDPPDPSSALEAEVQRGLNLAPEVPVLLWAGRLAPEKRLDVFLRACATLRASGQPFAALIAGDGADRGALQGLAAALRLGEHVRFLGFREDVEDIIRVARVVVLTSDVEGLPNILIEAQLGGRPVVATRAGGTEEVVEHGVTGFLVEVGDQEALARDLGRLLDDPALAARLGRAGAERSRRLFGAERMGAATLAIYRELAERRGSRMGPIEPAGQSAPRLEG